MRKKTAPLRVKFCNCPMRLVITPSPSGEEREQEPEQADDDDRRSNCRPKQMATQEHTTGDADQNRDRQQRQEKRPGIEEEEQRV